MTLLAITGFFVGRSTNRIHTPPATHALPLDPSAPNHSSVAHGHSGGRSDEEPADVANRPWAERWAAGIALPSTPARDRQLAQLTEELARSDPKQALALSAAEPNWRLRDDLRDASLRGWAAVDPQAAGDWARQLRIEDRRQAVAAVLEGAASSPERAVHVALQLCSADPETAGDFGHAAVAALVKAGAFEAALRFTTEVGTDRHPYLLKSAFYQWAQHQPDKAFTAADTIANPVARSEALGEVFSGWAKADAKAVAEYALKLPAGEARSQALAEALPQWMEHDPAVAMEWIQNHDSGADFDHGLVALSTQPGLIASKPANALACASAISDPKQRNETMRSVIRLWLEKEPAAARQFIAGATDPKDRALFNEELDDHTP